MRPCKSLLALTIFLLLISACSAPATPEPTSVPTAMPTLTAVPTGAPTSTVVFTFTSTIQSTRLQQTASNERAALVHETIPDNSVVKPGEEFVKTFEIKNTGNTPWTSAYVLALDFTAQTDDMGSPTQIALAEDVPPGETVTFSISLKAPSAIGKYSIYWRLINDRGETIPVDGGVQIWVRVNVCDDSSSCTASTAAGGNTVGGITATLIDFTYDSESASVNFCMNMSNRNYSLDSPAPVLLIDKIPAPFLDGGSIPLWGCLQMRYQVTGTAIEQAQSITLSINAPLRMSPPPGDPNQACEAARANLMAQYPGLDFQCAFSMAGYAKNIKLPSGMAMDQATQLITDTIEGAIYGPWTLVVR